MGDSDQDDSDASLALADQLCFALYSASRAMTARYRPLLEDLGLSYPQYLVMLALWEDGPITIGRLGAQLRLGTATLSPLLQRMESDGLLTRQRRAEDQRQVIVAATPGGQALRERATRVRLEMCEAVGMDAGERDRLIGELHAVVASLGGPDEPTG